MLLKVPILTYWYLPCYTKLTESAKSNVMKGVFQHFACTLGLECQLCETNIDAFTRTLGMDVRNKADWGLKYSHTGLN